MPEQIDERIDEEGVRVQELDYPILNLFKMINGVFLFFIFIFMGFGLIPLWVKLMFVVSMALGFASLFVPSKKPKIKQFSTLSVGMYAGALVAYFAAQT